MSHPNLESNEEAETSQNVPPPGAFLSQNVLRPAARLTGMQSLPAVALVLAHATLAIAAVFLTLDGSPSWIVGTLWFASSLTDQALAEKRFPFWLSIRTVLDTLVICVLAYSIFRTGLSLHAVGAALVGSTGIYCATSFVKAARQEPSFSQRRLADILNGPNQVWGRWANSFASFVDRGTGLACAFLVLALGKVELVSAVAVAASTAWFTIAGQAIQAGQTGNKWFRLAIAYSVGGALIFYLASRLPLESLTESLQAIGWNALWALVPGPILAIFSAISLYVLCRGLVPASKLLYVQFVSNGYNQILPLAGLGGEPYKIRVLSDYLPPESAGQIVLIDRILHGIPGPLLGGAWLAFSAWSLELDPALEGSFFIAAVLLIALGCILLSVAFSRVPGKLTQFVAKKFTGKDLGGNSANVGISRKRLWLAFILKLQAQTVLFFEVWLLYRLVGIEPSIQEIALVAAFVTVSAIVFFVIPQQLGTNEAGISTAFNLLALPPTPALVFGLLRRARQVAWALFGVLLHVVFHLATRTKTQ